MVWDTLLSHFTESYIKELVEQYSLSNLSTSLSPVRQELDLAITEHTGMTLSWRVYNKQE